MAQIIQTASGEKIRVKVSQAQTKIHGPNSPRVLSGEVPEGFREPIPGEGPRLHELSYQETVALVGKEYADEIWKGADRGE